VNGNNVVERERERGRERESEREREKRNERTREKKMQQIFLCVHADVLCTDPDINFTEEREHTHTCTLKRK
jgi:hypothetical protein